jgi:hypothetical protein
LENADIFYGHLDILQIFGIFYAHLVHFSAFGIMYQEKSGSPGRQTFRAVKTNRLMNKCQESTYYRLDITSKCFMYLIIDLSWSY